MTAENNPCTYLSATPTTLTPKISCNVAISLARELIPCLLAWYSGVTISDHYSAMLDTWTTHNSEIDAAGPLFHLNEPPDGDPCHFDWVYMIDIEQFLVLSDSVCPEGDWSCEGQGLVHFRSGNDNIWTWFIENSGISFMDSFKLCP